MMDDIAFNPRCSISSLVRVQVECVGKWYISHWEGEPSKKEEVICLDDDHDEEEDGALFDEDDVDYLRSLDPKDWKDQDHYAVLGLRNVRYKATEEDIKRGYRKKVLRHHPDKRKAMGEEIRPDDDYFTCITKAWEILGHPRSRRGYDSVDPTIDDSIPPNTDRTKKNFYAIFGDAFERNARWSEKKPVPKLGNENSTLKEVENFYAFWYNFESWREFSYMDEDIKTKAESRDDRRFLEKQNKINREKLKKDEMARLRSLVDAAYFMDPRILKFKQEDKERKLAAKQAKKDAIRARVEEEERRIHAEEEEARRVKAEHDAEEKAKQDALKAEREAARKVLKNKRTALRKVVKAKDYFIDDENERVHHMASLEKICEFFQGEEIDKLTSKITDEGRKAFLEAISEVERRIEEEKQALMESTKRSGTDSNLSKSKGTPWSSEELALLIKAVKVFPAGTNQRWEVVANFINQHLAHNATCRSAKEVLSKAKDLQNSDYTRNILKMSANKRAFSSFEKEKNNVDIGAAVSERFDTPAEQQGVAKEALWTATEQQLLEQALKTYPASTPERWDKIAECIPTRNKKECMRRYKELVEMVKAKKAAQAAAATTSASAGTIVGPKAK